MANDKYDTLEEEQIEDLSKALKESAQLTDQLESFNDEYETLSKKYPLKNSKSRYSG